MIRKLTATTMIGALIGVLALAVIGRLQTPEEPTAQLPAEVTLRIASVRELFP